MIVRQFDHGSPEYAASCELRRRFLREAIGLTLTAGDVRDDAQQLHFGLFDDAGRLVASVIGKPRPDVGDGAAQIRQMVVHGDHRGSGHGRTLLLGAERLLGERGVTRLLLFARPEATPFYERCGYAATGETAELIGFEHHRMEKRTA